MEVISNNDLSSLQKKVEDKIEEENITAMELCAGFLKLHLGDDMEEIPAENYIEEMRKKRAERKAEEAAEETTDAVMMTGAKAKAAAADKLTKTFLI